MCVPLPAPDRSINYARVQQEPVSPPHLSIGALRDAVGPTDTSGLPAFVPRVGLRPYRSSPFGPSTLQTRTTDGCGTESAGPSRIGTKEIARQLHRRNNKWQIPSRKQSREPSNFRRNANNVVLADHGNIFSRQGPHVLAPFTRGPQSAAAVSFWC